MFKFTSRLRMVILLSLVATSWAEEPPKQKPLFEININHEFPDYEKCFQEVKQLILDNYYTTLITEKDLYWAAINGMLRHISPPDFKEQAQIWTAEQYKAIEDSLKGIKVSIGVKSSYNPADGSLTVTEVYPGSPAESILQPYDRILRIDGQALLNKSVQDIDNLLQGEEGSAVTLTVIRDIKSFEITIKREEFKANNMTVTVFANDVGYVELRKITANMADDLKKELTELQNKKITKLIIDLRNNTGGVFLDSLKIAELFLPEKGVLLRTLSRSDTPQNYVSSNKEPFNFTTAILVNKNTASSCEIITAALQDSKKAVVVGTHTYGKAVFDKTFTLENLYRVKFISGAMFTPLGKSWQTKGLLPDFAVEQDDNTYAALMKLTPVDRLQKDVCLLTGYKLVNK